MGSDTSKTITAKSSTVVLNCHSLTHSLSKSTAAYLASNVTFYNRFYKKLCHRDFFWSFTCPFLQHLGKVEKNVSAFHSREASISSSDDKEQVNISFFSKGPGSFCLFTCTPVTHCFMTIPTLHWQSYTSCNRSALNLSLRCYSKGKVFTTPWERRGGQKPVNTSDKGALWSAWYNEW